MVSKKKTCKIFCIVDVGVQIHEIEKPTSEYYCRQSPDFNEVQFKLYEEEGQPPRCIQFLKKSGDIPDPTGTWDKAREVCKKQGFYQFQSYSLILECKLIGPFSHIYSRVKISQSLLRRRLGFRALGKAKFMDV